MKIPRRFKIFAKTWEVRRSTKIDLEDGNYGICHPRKNEITVATPMKGIPTPTDVEVTFCHELTHTILDEVHYPDLYKDEAFVERFSKALHQALTTMEYK